MHVNGEVKEWKGRESVSFMLSISGPIMRREFEYREIICWITADHR